ncbi:TonB-dependent receptor [Maribellus maritimus]|uniref:TonB-dependent receptor n=1 Tax=Maribellus maritimus TaxID=2870838 RepID=UPI001EEBE070|nr:TonB-dependent receptor [Maribellus maritimus]MCG6187284.1 TonB-dependent receptor [Maribellus maritimus]
MKLTLLFSFLVFTASWANSFSQSTKLNLNLKNVAVQDLIQEIENQTDFYFLYQDDVFRNDQKITINAKDESLDVILKELEEQASVNAEIAGHQIILSKKTGKLEDMQQQTKQVTGVVVDDDGVSIPGVSVVAKGTSVGTVTNAEGTFQLDIPVGTETLLFSFVGKRSQEVSVDGKTFFSIVMQQEAIGIEEVVAIGYGSQKKRDITGAVTSVRSENFNKGVTTSPGQLLQGKVSGVNITSSSGAPGSGQRITIRGQGTIRQGSGPLFVVDGFPIGLAGTGSGTSPLNFINPEDIETMDVLKDASATAIYGSRGANGVILITTKRGKSGASNVSITSNIGISSISKKLPVLSADEFRKKVVEIGGILEDRGGNTDWQDELTRTVITQDQNLVMSGGSDKLTYRASLGYLDQKGIVINTGIKRYSGRVNATQKLLDGRLTIDFNLNSTIEKGENAHMGTVVSNMLSFNPTYPAYDSNGEPIKYPDLINPLSQAELFTDFSESRKMIINITPSFEIIDGLIYKLNFGYENRSSDSDAQEMPSTDPYVQGYLEQTFYNGTNTLIENYLTYTLDVESHNISLLAGYSYQKDNARSRSWNITQFEANDIEPRYNPGNGQILDLATNRPGGWAQINELQSYFGRATYSYQGKYMVTGTVRVDGSSKFGGNNKYGTFPSFAAGWRISEESFMESLPFSNLKLRAGWGQTGNQEIPPKITKESFQSSNSGSYSYPLSETGVYPVGTVYTRLANPDIQWEVSTQTNVGLDFGLFDGALSGTVDYFHKVSNNILVEVPSFDPVSPAPTYWTNVEGMNIINNGLEIALDYQHWNDNGFSYSFGANATFIDNVVEDSPFTVLTTGAASGSGQTGATINGMINGYPIGSFYMQKFTGIGSDGLSTYEPPLETDGDDRYVVGSALPDVMYNFYANLSYKRFDLSLNFNGVSGNEIYNHTAMNKFYKGQLATSNNVVAKALEFPEEAITNAALVSTRYLEDGSFLRLNNLTLGYDFDTNALGIGNWAKRLRLSLTGQNLFVITNYSGFDPEVNQDKSTGGVQSFGIDDNGYPKARTFVIGLNITF